jgi:RNA recognition motif-containing protein
VNNRISSPVFFFYTCIFLKFCSFLIFNTMNIYVSNLGFNVQDSNLKALFAAYGTVSSAKVIMDKMTNQSRGFGFVEMPDDTAAQKAIQELNGSMQDGRAIKASEARPREDRNSGRPSKW